MQQFCLVVVLKHRLGTTNTKSKFRFSIQKLHHCIREGVVSTTMQKFFMNTPNTTFPVMKAKHMPLFVVLKHIKLSNLIKQKSTTNSDQYDNIYYFFGVFLSLCQNFELTYLLATDFIFLFLVMIHNTLE